MKVSVEIQGLDDVRRLITRLEADKVRDDALDEVGSVMLNRTRTRFLAEQNPEYEKWQKSQAAIDRASLGLGGGTLFDTGNLFHSIRLSEPKRFERSISSDTEYGYFHQLGQGFVERQFIGVGTKDEQLIIKIVDTQIQGVLNNG